MSPTFPTTAFLAFAHRMVAEEVAAGRWTARWASDHDAALRCAQMLAADARRDPAKGAAIMVSECARLVGEIVGQAVELRRAA